MGWKTCKLAQSKARLTLRLWMATMWTSSLPTTRFSRACARRCMQRRMRLQRRTEASVQSARQSRGLLHTGCSLQGAHTDTDTQTHRHTQTHTQHCTVVLLECTKGFVWFHSMLVCIFVC